jgi:hypothetical protein
MHFLAMHFAGKCIHGKLQPTGKAPVGPGALRTRCSSATIRSKHAPVAAISSHASASASADGVG